MNCDLDAVEWHVFFGMRSTPRQRAFIQGLIAWTVVSYIRTVVVLILNRNLSQMTLTSFVGRIRERSSFFLYLHFRGEKA